MAVGPSTMACENPPLGIFSKRTILFPQQLPTASSFLIKAGGMVISPIYSGILCVLILFKLYADKYGCFEFMLWWVCHVQEAAFHDTPFSQLFGSFCLLFSIFPWLSLDSVWGMDKESHHCCGSVLKRPCVYIHAHAVSVTAMVDNRLIYTTAVYDIYLRMKNINYGMACIPIL